MDTTAPIQSFYDLGGLSEAGYERVVSASPAELARLAQWEQVQSVDRFEGRVTLKRLSQKRFRYDATLAAEITQSCVVTLEPVRTQITRNFSRELHFTASRIRDDTVSISISPVEDEAPEDIDSLRFDLAGPLLEEFSLAIDPYPRSPGVEFEPPQDELPDPEGPFAVLKSLNRG